EMQSRLTWATFWFFWTVGCCVGSWVKPLKSRLGPPLGRGSPPSSSASGTLLLLRSRWASTLLPRVSVNSGPATPLVSCQPNGEAVGSAGFVMTTKPPSPGEPLDGGIPLYESWSVQSL